MLPNAELYTFNQIKEIMEKNEDTILKCFSSTVDRLEKKIQDLTEENFNLKNDMNELKNSHQKQFEKVMGNSEEAKLKKQKEHDAIV